MDEQIYNQIKIKLQLPQNVLFEELGKTATKGAYSEDLKRKGKDIFETLKGRLVNEICTSSTVINAYKSINSNEVVPVVAALIDVLSGYLVGISPVTFCVLIVKEGIPKLCKSYWKGIEE